MRIGKRITFITGIAAALAAGGFANAGKYISNDEGGGAYQFTDCVKPEKPVLTVDRALKGRKAFTAHNANVRRYNKYVASANAYMECLTNEADRDIQIHFQAVSGGLEFEQQAMIVGLEDMLVEINTAEPVASGSGAAGDAETLERELLGGQEEPEE